MSGPAAPTPAGLLADPLVDALERLLADRLAPAAVRRAERDGPDPALWQALHDSGLDQALLPEALGGAGLDWREVQGLWRACGRHALPALLADTLLARGLAGAGGRALPAGAIAVGAARVAGARVVVQAVPWGAEADTVLALAPGQAWLLPRSGATVTPHPAALAERSVDLACDAAAALAQWTLPPGVDGIAAGAALRCQQMAGALDAVLALTLDHVAQRRQFGRALGAFQAVQQQVAVLAEDVLAAGMAAAVATDRGPPDRLRAGAAKLVAGEAAARAVATAHALHGAIGITDEHALSLYSRRLQAWRLQFGGEGAWARELGRAVIDDAAGDTWDFARRLGGG